MRNNQEPNDYGYGPEDHYRRLFPESRRRRLPITLDPLPVPSEKMGEDSEALRKAWDHMKRQFPHVDKS